ncbi:hypothetical protein PPACK8108_LOCUS15093 [Phakopsora pachyrhizi]|uniref:GED domain-containing protein n=1 Tax=Phakopsora pachyrhizi TaxID=170000 RepID=A0AAV0B8B6_PHAPC|nr:hypothetical protein PPACK8108_LOCUS15093 [Phakopsora pachyrhizi]
MLDLQDLTEKLFNEGGQLEPFEDIQLRTILTSKLKPKIHANLISPEIEKDARAIWILINDYFASSQFNKNDIPEFITKIKSSISKLFEVGISILHDIIAYLILDKLPLSMDSILHQITHSDKEINSDMQDVTNFIEGTRKVLNQEMDIREQLSRTEGDEAAEERRVVVIVSG